jgi:phosphonatase-like hydrolase
MATGPAAPELVILDVGGTTIRDDGAVQAAFAAALAGSGVELDEVEMVAWRGASKREILERLVASRFTGLAPAARSSLASELYDRFRQALEIRWRDAGNLAIPGARGAFERLKAAGIHVALNSGFDRAIMEIVLANAGWPGTLIDAVVTTDDVPAGRPAPFLIFRSMERTNVQDVRRVAVVGDTRLDLEAAANAGVLFRIGVLTGAHDRAALDSAPHTHIVPSVADVPDIWLAPVTAARR